MSTQFLKRLQLRYQDFALRNGPLPISEGKALNLTLGMLGGSPKFNAMRSWQICLSSSRVSWNESVDVQSHEKMRFVILSYFRIAFFVVDFKVIARPYILRNKRFECNLKADLKFCSKLNYLQLKE